MSNGVMDSLFQTVPLCCTGVTGNYGEEEDEDVDAAALNEGRGRVGGGEWVEAGRSGRSWGFMMLACE